MSILLSGIFKKTIVSSLSLTRSISLTSASRLKEIEINRDEQKQTLTIKANYVSSANEPFLVKALTECQKNGTRFCPECTLGLDIKHTVCHQDVLILSQYVRDDGCMLPRRVTGLCKRQQKRIGTMVTMAQKAGLMINKTPASCKKDPRKRYGMKRFNQYYFEDTIKSPCY